MPPRDLGNMPARDTVSAGYPRTSGIPDVQIAVGGRIVVVDRSPTTTRRQW